MKSSAFIIVLALAVCAASAANFYVDYATGSDINAGDSTSSPWKHSPGDTALITTDTTLVGITTSTATNWTQTTVSNCVNAYAMVSINTHYPNLPASVTFNGVVLTNIVQQVDGANAWVCFYGGVVGTLNAGTYNVQVSTTPSLEFIAASMVFQNVVQTNPVASAVSSATTSIGLTIPAHGLGVCAAGSLYGNTILNSGGTQVTNVDDGSVLKLGVATTSQTGSQTFIWYGSGYGEVFVAVVLNLTTSGGPYATQLNPGDTVHFKGGVSYILTGTNGSSGIVVSQSGTSGARICYDGNYAGTWGTGKALVTDNFGNNNRTAFYFPSGLGSNVLIQNFDIGQIGGTNNFPTSTNELAANPGNGVFAQIGFQNVTIADCYFHELGYWQNQKPVGNSSLGGSGVANAGASFTGSFDVDNLTITNCEFTKMRHPIQIQCYKQVLGLKIVSCYIHDYVEWCMDLALQTGSYFDNSSVQNCTFQDWDKWYSTNHNTGFVGWDGWEDPPHQNGIYYRADTAGNGFSTNVNFFNNHYRSTGSWAGGTSGQYVEGPAQCNIYNNVFDYTHPANACLVMQGYNGYATNALVRIWNNTFNVTGTAIYNTMDESDSTWTKIDTRNNILRCPNNPAGSYFLVSYVARTLSSWTNVYSKCQVSDYNSFESYNSDAPMVYFSIVTFFVSGGYNYMGLDFVRSSYGFETHSITNTAVFVDAANGNYQLQSSSAQIGAGANLTSLTNLVPGITRDLAGNLRPATGGWTMGAFEYVPPPPPPPPLFGKYKTL